MFKTKLAIIALMASVALTGCGPTPQSSIPNLPLDNSQVQQAPAQAQSEGYGAGTVAAAALGGAVLGHMVGKRNSEPRTVIVHQPSPAPSYYGGGYRGYGSRKTVTTTVTKRSMFGGKTVTRTTTRRR